MNTNLSALLALVPTLLRRIPSKLRLSLYVGLAGYALTLLVGPAMGLPISTLAWHLFSSVAGLLGVVAAGNVTTPLEVLEDVLGRVVAPTPVTPPAAAPAVTSSGSVRVTVDHQQLSDALGAAAGAIKNSTAVKKAPAKKTAPAKKNTPATAAKTPPVKKVPPVKAPAKKAPAKPPAKTAPKPPAKKAPAKKAPAKKTPAKPATFIRGIDVAGYQSTAYGTKGNDFVIVKATEGNSYVNPKYAGQLATGRKAGLVVGHYHFLHHGNIGAQVAFFKVKADVKPGEIIALDWEASTTTQADRDAWIQGIRAVFPHNRVILYCNVNFWTHLDTENFAADGLWIAEPSAPPGHPRIKHPWLFHQYSEVGGIDHNVANFPTKAALAAWATGA